MPALKLFTIPCKNKVWNYEQVQSAQIVVYKGY